ncbi:aldehyde dehydrogenase family protein [Cupriavidus sp. USMAA2-4]|uniref:Aldehyde dehydrogenase family protein n=1 Tax=Cupriavidus malaysiensis TaxID=367825 RepID=A0ABM6F451_9BURK|nr:MULTISPECIES: aldehyde dehydrogenase family protein [Cupriavidus]AOY90825.1 aldehyde dehydrogenase family protein [Cupriavidus sp. USMAA2-4]AOY99569.1 aldehyde dehydrogenase family protein [Cupriavidus sp. USMAHM13]AOZ06217.1 aldehyde dehydrogenase family protein [Cupriavidus malaysiensis]
MQQRDKLFINGKWVAPHGAGHIDVIHSATEAVMGRIPEGSTRDAEDAILAARAAFDGWAATPAAVRAEYIRKIAEGLKARSEELAQLIAGEVGMPIKMARAIQVGGPVYNWGQAAKLLENFHFEEEVGNSLVVREPVGVVAAITPWNYPLNQITLKVAPALAAGCTVVLKPSEVAPLNAFVLAEVIEAAGLPPGVFNLVTGFGPVVGEVLASHPEVDMVSFTGSTRAGKRVSELASQTVKRVALELGGKSASVILDDADLAAAVKGSVSACFLNSGQTCSAHTRMLVPRARYEEAKTIAKQVAEAFTVGDPLQESTKLGPLISATQRERVTGYIRRGVNEGAELVTGGPDAPAGLDKGFYVKPTVLGNVDPRATVAQEEIFGPVLSIICYDTEEEAVRIANDSIYGLGGGVWSGDEARAVRVARRIRTGQVDINGGPFNMSAPFGGYKQSGNGREAGKYGLEEFLEYKSLQFKKPAA